MQIDVRHPAWYCITVPCRTVRSLRRHSAPVSRTRHFALRRTRLRVSEGLFRSWAAGLERPAADIKLTDSRITFRKKNSRHTFLKLTTLLLFHYLSHSCSIYHGTDYTRNSSGDDSERELSLRHCTVHALENTIDYYTNSAIDRYLQRRFAKFSAIMQSNGHYAVQGHSRSPILIPIESSYTTSY